MEALSVGETVRSWTRRIIKKEKTQELDVPKDFLKPQEKKHPRISPC